MSLMNDALCSLDDLRKYNNSNDYDKSDDKNLRYIQNILSEDPAAVDESPFFFQAQNDVLNNEDNQTIRFIFFHEFHCVKLFLICLFFLIFGCVSYFLMHKEKSDISPFLYGTISYYDAMKPFAYLNPLLDSSKGFDQYEVDKNRASDNGIRHENLIDNEALDDGLAKEMEDISLLNDKGYAALANDFLSTPKNNNAMTYFKQVLAIDENNILALQGVDSIYRRYQKLIESNVDRHNWTHAQIMLNRFLAIGGDEESVKIYKQLIVKNEKEVESVSSNSSFAHVNSNSYFSVERSSYYLEKEAFFRSQQWVQKNKIEEAIDELNVVLSVQNYLTKATAEFLFDLYLRSGDIDAARVVSHHVKSIKKSMLNNNSWDTVYESARIEQVKNGDLAALLILHKSKAEWLGESSARLYAGLLQKNGDYALAQNMYRNLLNMYHKNATYWLGYGVSSDALGELDNALIGYRKTQSLGGVSSGVEAHITNRIFVLQSGINSSSHVMEPSW